MEEVGGLLQVLTGTLWMPSGEQTVCGEGRRSSGVHKETREGVASTFQVSGRKGWARGELCRWEKCDQIFFFMCERENPKVLAYISWRGRSSVSRDGQISARHNSDWILGF